MLGRSAERLGAATMWRSDRMCQGLCPAYGTSTKGAVIASDGDSSNNFCTLSQSVLTSGLTRHNSVDPTPRSIKGSTAVTNLPSKTLTADGSWYERPSPCQSTVVPQTLMLEPISLHEACITSEMVVPRPKPRRPPPPYTRPSSSSCDSLTPRAPPKALPPREKLRAP